MNEGELSKWKHGLWKSWVNGERRKILGEKEIKLDKMKKMDKNRKVGEHKKI